MSVELLVCGIWAECEDAGGNGFGMVRKGLLDVSWSLATS